MTALLTAPVTGAPPRAGRALAAAETRLLLRSPVFWVATAAAAGLATAWGWTTMPTWAALADDAGMAAVLLAAVLVLLGHLAASRDHRAGAAEAAAMLPAPPPRRTAALLATAPAGLLAGALVLAAPILLALPALPAGRLDVWNLAPVLLLPVLGLTLGVAVGRWLPATAAGPLAAVLAGLAATVPLLVTLDPGGTTAALVPVSTLPNWAPGAPEPSGWHVLWLCALLAVIVAAALARHRRGPAALLALAAVALAVPAAERQSVPRPGTATMPVTEALAAPYTGPAALRCRNHGPVRYCALPGFEPWIPLWREAVEPVVAVLPPGSPVALPVVRQQDDTVYGPGPGQARVADVGPRWGRHGWADDSRIELAQTYAGALLATPLWTPDRQEPCSGAGQLRTVVALWLVAQAVPGGDRLLAVDNTLWFGLLQYGRPEADAALRLLSRPRTEVTAALTGHWDALRSGTPAGDVLAQLGVPPLTSGGNPCP